MIVVTILDVVYRLVYSRGGIKIVISIATMHEDFKLSNDGLGFLLTLQVDAHWTRDTCFTLCIFRFAYPHSPLFTVRKCVSGS